MVHKQIISDEQKQLMQEKKDLDYMKVHNPSGYETGEDKLKDQDYIINRTSDTIRKLRDR